MTRTETVPTTETTEFEVGTTYAVRSIGDWDCIWTFRVEKRTARFVTLRNVTHGEGETMRVGIYVWDGTEHARPFGSYSMAPSISADRTTV